MKPIRIKEAIERHNKLKHESSQKLNQYKLGLHLFPTKAPNTINNYMSLIISGKRLSLLTPERVEVICNLCAVTPEWLGIEYQTIKTIKL